MATSTVSDSPSIAFRAGDTVNLQFGFGYIIDSNKNLDLFFPVGKINSGLPITISSSTFTISLRRGDTTGGYVGGSSGLDIKSYLSTATWWRGYIQMVFVKSSGWGVTNNAPVAGGVSGTIRFG